MSWVGGKKALRDEIVLRFPLEFERYVEVFGGGGWVLFHKPPSPFEVYNDFKRESVACPALATSRHDPAVRQTHRFGVASPNAKPWSACLFVGYLVRKQKIKPPKRQKNEHSMNGEVT